MTGTGARPASTLSTRETRAETTKTAILDTAERLFAEQGVMSVSNRQVSEAAGQGNNTAVGYHFGTKQDLTRAAFRRHQEDIDRRRTAMVAAVRDASDVRAWVSCLVRPTADHLAALQVAEGRTYFARLSAQLLADPELRFIVIEETREQASLHATIRGLDGTRPDMPKSVLRERNRMLRQLITWGYAEREVAMAAGVDDTAWGEFADIVVDALTGMWLAPWDRSVR